MNLMESLFENPSMILEKQKLFSKYQLLHYKKASVKKFSQK